MDLVSFSLFPTEHFRKALSFSWNTERRRKKLWNYFLKFIFKKLYLFFFTSAVIGIPADKSASAQEESKVYWSPLLCSTELHRRFYCTFAASNFPRLFNDSLLLQHKRQARNLRPHFAASDRTWHHTLTAFDDLACSLKAIRLHSDQGAEKKEESFVKPNL